MIAEGIIVAARLFQFASTLVLFGSSVFFLYGYSASPDAPRHPAWPQKILLIAAIGAFASALLWAMGQTALLNDDAGAALVPSSVWQVLSDTRIGRINLLRFVLLAASILATLWVKDRHRDLWFTQAILSGALVASFAWSGHGIKDDGWQGALHLGADIFHLLAAAVWIGALVPLADLILHSHRVQSKEHAQAAHIGLVSFSRIGIAVVAVLVLTGIVNTWFLIGPEHWRELFTSLYGLVLVMKLALFGLMLLLATANRFWLTPQLRLVLEGSDSMAAALRALRTSVLLETGLAVLVLAAVAYLGTLAPPVSGG